MQSSCGKVVKEKIGNGLEEKIGRGKMSILRIQNFC